MGMAPTKPPSANSVSALSGALSCVLADNNRVVGSADQRHNRIFD